MRHFKILYTADMHGNEKVYEKLFIEAAKDEFRAVIIGGDLCPSQPRNNLALGVQKQKDFLEKWLLPKIREFREQKPIEFFVITGNDDFKAVTPVLEAAHKEGTIRFLNHNMYKIGDMMIAGYPFINPTPFAVKDWEKGDLEPEHLEGLRTMPEGPVTSMLQDFEFLGQHGNAEDTVYVIHAPPYGTKLDMIYGGQHVGSKAVRHFVDEHKPYLTLHGHIHESFEVSREFMETTDSTVSINPGSNYGKDRLHFVTMDLYNLATIKHKII